MYENAELCKQCGGECCKGMPGICSPEDVTGKVLELLRTGRYCMDWWEGGENRNDGLENEVYYLRPSTLDEVRRGQYRHGSWGGRCTFHGVNGCELRPDERPYGCRMLEPKPNKLCVNHSEGKEAEVKAWIPFQFECCEALNAMGG